MKKKPIPHFAFPALLSLILPAGFLLGSAPAYAAASPLQLSVETIWLSGRAEGNETEQITVRYDAVMGYDAMSTEYTPLQEALDQMDAEEISKGQSYMDWYLSLFSSYIEDGGSVSDFTPCSCYNTALVKRADSSVTSIVYQTEAYAGGAHPNTFHTSYNFRTSDGAELDLSDVFTDLDQLREILYGQLAVCYPSVDASLLDDYDLEDLTWSLDEDGLTVYVGEYILGSLYDGFQTLHVPYDEYSPYFADWLEEPAVTQGTELGNYEPIWRDLDGSGVPEIIQVGFNTGEGTDAENSRQLRIYYDGEYAAAELPACQDLFTTLLHHNGQDLLYIEASQDLDLAWTGLYRLDAQNGTITYVGTDLPAGAELYTSHIMIQFPLDMYGTGEGYTAQEIRYMAENEGDVEYDGYDEYDPWYYGNSEFDDEYDVSIAYGDDTLLGDLPDLVSRPPFYGVWISASKNLDASWALADLIQADGVMGWVFDSSEWSNLNPEPWYLVTAGVYYTYEEALAGLARIQEAGYTDAYIKYSGESIVS